MNRFSELLSMGFIMAAALLAEPRSAQATQPLSTFFERAFVDGMDARESAANFTQRDAEADASFGRLLPSFTARGIYQRNQHSPSFGGQTITPYNQLDAYLQLDVPLVDLVSYHRYKAQRFQAEAANGAQAVTRLDVARSITRGYFLFIGASALVRSAEASVESAKDNLRLVEARRSAGVTTDLDQERALANVARAEQDVADAKLGADLAARALETLSGLLPQPADNFPQDDLREEAPFETWRAMSQKSPVVQVARTTSEAVRQSQKAAARGLWPTLSANAQEHFTNSTLFSGGNAASYTFQLVAAFRLDYSVIATNRALTAATAVQKVREERTQRAVEDTTYESFRRVQAGIAKSRAARVQQKAASRAADLAVERYAAGAATQLDVTTAQRDAFLADAARIQADAELSAARIVLRLAAGHVPMEKSGP